MIFIQLIFILFGLIQTELIQQELSPLPESVVRTDCHSDDCDVFYVTTNIENVKVGDYVLAQDVETGEVTLKEVTNTFIRTSDHLRYLTTIDAEGDTQTIETTDAHPFWVVTDNPDLSRAAGEYVVENGTILYHENLAVTEHGYYVEAKDLKVGDVFIGANGELTTLTDTYREKFPDGVTVYNFTVADNHNYYVIANLEAYENGASVVLVHNATAVWYHGTDTDSANDILKNGLSQEKLKHSSNLVEDIPKGLYVTDDIGMSKDYARIRSNGSSGKILEFSEEIEDLLIGAGTKNNEAIIPFASFDKIKSNMIREYE